jgi:hypothetical protein
VVAQWWGNYDGLIASAPGGSHGPPSPSITGISVAPNTFTVPGTLSGTLATTCSPTCPRTATYTLDTSSGHCTYPNNSAFGISGSTLSLPNEVAGTYHACISVAMSGVSKSGAACLVTLTGTSPSGCTSSIAGITNPPCPYNVAAPSGYHWNLTFDDEFTRDSVIDTTRWCPAVSLVVFRLARRTPG